MGGGVDIDFDIWYNHPMSIAKKITSGFGILLLLLIVVTVISYRNAGEIINSSEWILHTHEVLEKLDVMEAKLIDAETGQRGYIITGDIDYLEPYNSANQKIYVVFENLAALTSDNPIQQDKLDDLKPLIQSKLDELNETIILRKDVGFEAASQIVLNNTGKQTMDEIRELLNKMRVEENRLLEERSQLPEKARKDSDMLLIILLGFGVLLGLVIQFFTTRSITRPIALLTKGAKIFGKGDLKYRIEVEGSDETAKLAESFNEMANQISESHSNLEKRVEERTKDLKEEQQEVVVLLDKLKVVNKIIRHDILGRLTNVRLVLELSELIENNKNIKVAYENVLGGVSLIQELGQLEEIKKNGGALELFDLREILEEIGKNQAVKININGDCKVNADNAIKSVFENLIRNTKIHGGVNTVDVDIQKEKAKVLVYVKDSGSGIPEEVRGEIFKEGFSSGETGNTGLGLHIVKKTIERYGGSIRFEPNHPKGSIFVIELPKE